MFHWAERRCSPVARRVTPGRSILHFLNPSPRSPSPSMLMLANRILPLTAAGERRLKAWWRLLPRPFARPPQDLLLLGLRLIIPRCPPRVPGRIRALPTRQVPTLTDGCRMAGNPTRLGQHRVGWSLSRHPASQQAHQVRAHLRHGSARVGNPLRRPPVPHRVGMHLPPPPPSSQEPDRLVLPLLRQVPTCQGVHSLVDRLQEYRRPTGPPQLLHHGDRDPPVRGVRV